VKEFCFFDPQGRLKRPYWYNQITGGLLEKVMKPRIAANQS